MKVRVDDDKCQGHSRCYALAPELFEVDELGMSTAIGDGTVSLGQEALAQRAAANCPEFAIEILDE